MYTGDGKTYEHLMEIKRLYGNSLDKLLIFPGDWHTLKNVQPVLIKIYYYAGLKELAQKSGFKGKTLTSLERCSNFKRTHSFLLQAWQSLYRGMLTSFFKANTGLPEVTIDETIPFLDMFQQLHPILSDKKTFHQFLEYVHKQAELDDMWKFWYSFVFMEGLVYIQLYIAIRCQNWEKRVSSLKLMTPTFIAYDRTTYQKLIPHHLAELQKFPPSIMNKLKQGFTVSNGERGHAVAFDEAHDMCINKDMKMAIVRPTQSYLQKTSLFLRYRISAHKNLLAQLFPQYDSKPVRAGIVDRTPEIKAKEENIIAMTETINKTNLFITPVQENRGLSNMFTSIKATPEQRHDLLKFRQLY